MQKGLTQDVPSDTSSGQDPLDKCQGVHAGGTYPEGSQVHAEGTYPGGSQAVRCMQNGLTQAVRCMQKGLTQEDPRQSGACRRDLPRRITCARGAEETSLGGILQTLVPAGAEGTSLGGSQILRTLLPAGQRRRNFSRRIPRQSDIMLHASGCRRGWLNMTCM